MSEEKPFEPSKKKLEKARRDGKVARSTLFTQLFSIVIVLTSLPVLCSFSWVEYKILLEYLLTQGYSDPLPIVGILLKQALKIVVFCLIFGTLSSILLEILQVGLRFEPAVLLPKASMLDLEGGIKRILTGLKSGWVSPLRVIFWGLLACWLLKSSFGAALALGAADHSALIAGLFSLWKQFCLIAFVAALVFGVGDWLVQRRKFNRELGMSHDEMRRELKEDEGDPQVKSHRKALHEAMIMQEMVKRVRSSKVIIVD